jgi:mannitol 2-dehydrogenase
LGFLTSCAKRAKGNPILWIDETNLYGDIAESHVFRTEFSMQLASIWEHGVNSPLKVFYVTFKAFQGFLKRY